MVSGVGEYFSNFVKRADAILTSGTRFEQFMFTVETGAKAGAVGGVAAGVWTYWQSGREPLLRHEMGKATLIVSVAGGAGAVAGGVFAGGSSVILPLAVVVGGAVAAKRAWESVQSSRS